MEVSKIEYFFYQKRIFDVLIFSFKNCDFSQNSGFDNPNRIGNGSKNLDEEKK